MLIDFNTSVGSQKVDCDELFIFRFDRRIHPDCVDLSTYFQSAHAQENRVYSTTMHAGINCNINLNYKKPSFLEVGLIQLRNTYTDKYFFLHGYFGSLHHYP